MGRESSRAFPSWFERYQFADIGSAREDQLKALAESTSQ